MVQLYRIWGYEAALDEANCAAATRVGLLCQQGERQAGGDSRH